MELQDPQRHGFDAARLARIDDFLAETYVDPGLLPGVQWMVARDGIPVQGGTLGIHREGGGALREDAIFRIASMTKPVTSLAFMKLVEQGKTALDQPVAAVVPELENVAVYAGGGVEGEPFRTVQPERPMLMVDLLRHTSGLTYDFQQVTPVDAAYRKSRLLALRGETALEPFVAALGEIPLEFSPGTAWNYSVSTDVLALVVERLAGEPFERHLARTIFEPLGMKAVSYTHLTLPTN